MSLENKIGNLSLDNNETNINNVLTINVTENPIIEDVRITGIKNKSIIKNLTENISLKNRISFTDDLLNRDINVIKNILKTFAVYFITILISTSSIAGMSDNDKSKAWDCVGIYMANYFLPSGETFEYAMKEKSISTVKVLKSYALEIGIPEKEWDEGVNKAVDKHYGSKYDEAKTEKCHTFVEALVPNGAERIKKVVQTLY